MAKRETNTDRQRAEELVFRYAKSRHGDLVMVLGEEPTAEFREKYKTAISLAMDAINLGRALATAGGKPGKRKAKKGAKR